MQPLAGPSDLFSKKMLNNTYEGVKTIIIEAGSVIDQAGNALGRWVSGNMPDQGSPEASDFYDSNSTLKGSGIEILSNTGLNANGTLALPSAEKGSTVILEQNEVPVPGDAGGILGDAAVKATQASRTMFYGAKALEAGKAAIDQFKDIGKGSLKLDTTYTTQGGTVKVSKFSPAHEKENNK